MKWKISGLIAMVIIVLIISLLWFNFNKIHNRVNLEKPHFVGGQTCIECHEETYNLWLESDHDRAMKVATDESVLGDFNNAIFVSKQGDTSTFYKIEGKFFVFTKGIGGEFRELEITHTFGYWPLQNYLIPFDNGKKQVLYLTWNSRENEWYDMAKAVYAHEDVTADNWLYWTNQAQNWNGMCADCHSTNLRKNYNTKTQSYQTTWSDINVNCEACHGPGSAHLAWAALPGTERSDKINTALVVNTRHQDAREHAELCARCHLRRHTLSDFDHFGNSLLDYYVPMLTGEPYYYSDGQIKEEDYVYGSFLQSKMFVNNVTCNSCHDVHSLKLRKTGNDLCLVCHSTEVYDNYNHHFHKKKDNPELQQGNHRQMYNVEGEGALCINCHMDGDYLMGVDYRRDHSFRIPRPDLTLSLGVPNACNSCHTDKTAQWSQNFISKWYGKPPASHYGSVIAAGEDADPAALDGLIAIADAPETTYAVMVRATALALLANYDHNAATATLRKHLSDDDPIMRYYAVYNLNPSSIEEFIGDFVPMLQDSVKAIRSEAANQLTQLPTKYIDSSWRQNYSDALHEYAQAQEYMADFPTGAYNLANLEMRQGKQEAAMGNYLKAIEIDNQFFPAKINLAMLYNGQKKNREAERLFREVLRDNPEQTEIYYSLGLLLAEMNRYDEAATNLEKAGEKMPQQSRIFYNLGLVYQYLQQPVKAEKTFLKALALEPENQSYIYALVDFYIKSGQPAKAEKWSTKLNHS